MKEKWMNPELTNLGLEATNDVTQDAYLCAQEGCRVVITSGKYCPMHTEKPSMS
ncbi:hypothetical protein ACSW8X_12135 [Clostridium perfringens]|uniref:hypothetical protein n=1 Tax=Clostridium perfringens TaxID=1502 RepID=UPI00016BD353|nr:hypothetical protein [Clostridium perfringens]EJT6558880.1 hypothetical protein [Clostridium perfringens]ELC8459758.1 hypothetical protein [Clostridium perfringens]MCX0376862.1 hypothetical protein [Clostridium perfringens]UBK86558.1 hypothetical protein KLF48_03030 [Clostridium perfringens]